MKILIVEDEQKTAALLKELIETHPNYTVMSICDSVETAVNYLKTHQPYLESAEKVKITHNSLIIRRLY